MSLNDCLQIREHRMMPLLPAHLILDNAMGLTLFTLKQRND